MQIMISASVKASPRNITPAPSRFGVALGTGSPFRRAGPVCQDVGMDNLAHTHMDDSHSQDSADRQMDRRGLLRFGGTAALAGAAVAAVGALHPTVAGAAEAAAGTMRFGATNAAGLVATGLTSSNATFSLSVTNSGLGSAKPSVRWINLQACPASGSSFVIENASRSD